MEVDSIIELVNIYSQGFRVSDSPSPFCLGGWIIFFITHLCSPFLAFPSFILNTQCSEIHD
jgi:hypothetical protein